MSTSDLNIPLRVKALRQESIACLNMVFEKPRGLTFEPGDGLNLRFPTPIYPVGRTYSFASSPTETDLLIAFKQGVSLVKKALENVKSGDTLLITQYGSNGFS